MFVFLHAYQKRLKIQLPAGDAYPQSCQRVDKTVQRLITAFLTVPEYFPLAVYPFFNLLLCCQLLSLGQVENFRVVRKMYGAAPSPYRYQPPSDTPRFYFVYAAYSLQVYRIPMHL